MAKVRNVSGEPLVVPELGYRAVGEDEVLDVPDDRYDGYVCQEGMWEPVAEPKAKKGRD